jgi:tryptophan-rich sensory protein
MEMIEIVGSPRKHSVAALFVLGGITAAFAALGTIGVRKSVDSPWYVLLRKPTSQPPRQAFGAV